MNREQRGNALRTILDKVRKQEYPYEERPKKPINWSAYDNAQISEMADMLNYIKQVVDEAARRIASRKEEKKAGPGRPQEHHPADLAKVLLLQKYLDAPNRTAEGLLLLFSEKLGIRTHFSYKTIERAYDDEDVKEVLDEVFRLTNEPVQGKETDFSVDGSGKPTSNKQNYAKDRQRQKNSKKKASEKGEWPRGTVGAFRDYQYHLAVIGVRYKLFSAWVSTSDHSIGEPSMFPEAMAQAYSNHPGMERMLGDGIFATRPCCNTVHQYGVRPYFLPRRNATLKRKGSDAWVKMNFDLVKDPQQWLSIYHMRSISETGFSMTGRANKCPLRKRLSKRKVTEDYLGAIVHNIKRLCYLTYLEDLDVDFTSKICS